MTKRFCLMWALACMRDHFQLTALCNSLSNKYLFIGHFYGKHKLLLVRDSQFLFSLAESREMNICSGVAVPSPAQNTSSLFIPSEGCRRCGIWALPAASSKTERFLVPFYTFLLWVYHPSWCKKKEKSCCVYFTCVCPKGRAVLSSALEILFLSKKVNRKVVFAHSKKRKIAT